MIIRAMANALIQCVTRTQPGWMTLPVWGVTSCSLTVRLDIVDPSLASVTLLIRGEPAFRYCIGAIRTIDGGHEGHKKASRASAGSLPCASRWGTGTSRARGLRRRQQDGVDHVDNAVRLMDVGNRDHRAIALGVDDPDLAVGPLHGEFFAFGGLELLAVGQVGRVKLPRDHMIGEDLGQGRLVLRLDQI